MTDNTYTGAFVGTPIQEFNFHTDSVIALRYKCGSIPADVLMQRWKEVCNAFPDNDVIAIPIEISVEEMSCETAIKIMEQLQDAIIQLGAK